MVYTMSGSNTRKSSSSLSETTQNPQPRMRPNPQRTSSRKSGTGWRLNRKKPALSRRNPLLRKKSRTIPPGKGIPTVRIEWNILSELNPDILARMQEAADQCLVSEKVDAPCIISVCLCDDEYIRDINRRYRNIDRATDVLSFPTVSYPADRTAGSCEALLRREYDADTGACFLGDLFIYTEHVALQAAEYGHSPMREAVYLLVHGICHLMGYDHIEPHDKEKMRSMEEKILSSVNVGRDNADESGDEHLLTLAREAMKRSYSPYSSYPVGAALRCTDGRIFLGCNIENASFSLTNCAERTAVFKAVSEGATSFDAIAISAKTKAWPCGACRQVLNEFAPDIRVLVTWDGHAEEKNLSELLPEGFGPRSMDQDIQE